jgi:hypothetical protein
MSLAVWVKLSALVLLKGVDEWFLSSVAHKSLQVANEADIGRSVLFLSEQVRDGFITKERALILLRQESAEIEGLMSDG